MRYSYTSCLLAINITLHCILYWHSHNRAFQWQFIHGASVAQSSEQAPFTSEIMAVMGSILATDSCMALMWKESVNALPKVVGFLRVLQFPPTRNVDRVSK
jgi:hypothetical protein